MEQLTEIAITLRGIKEEPDGSSTLVVAEISTPITDHDDHTWCNVSCPEVLDGIKPIFGVDGEQALVLSESLIRELWAHSGIIPEVS